MRILLERDPPTRFEFVFKTYHRRFEIWQTSELRSWIRKNLPSKVSSVRTILHTYGGEHLHVLIGIRTGCDDLGILETSAGGLFHVEPVDRLPLSQLLLYRIKERTSASSIADLPSGHFSRFKEGQAAYHAGLPYFAIGNHNVIALDQACHRVTKRARAARLARRLLVFYS